MSELNLIVGFFLLTYIFILHFLICFFFGLFLILSAFYWIDKVFSNSFFVLSSHLEIRPYIYMPFTVTLKFLLISTYT